MSESYERIRVVWPDHLGLARGKYVPASHLGRVARHCTGTWALGFDRQMTPGTPGSFFFEGLPDMEALFLPDAIRPGWELRTGVVVADLERHGEPVAVAPRSALRRAVADWADLGYVPEIGVELEAYLMEPDPASPGGWRPISTPGAFVYGTGPAVDPHGLVDELWEAAERIGIEIEAMNSEYEESQFEFTLGHADALEAADRTFLFKQMARELAARRGYLWTFIGKPVTQRGGSGLHVNLSFTGPDRRNAVNDPDGPDGISPLARQATAGMLAHHRGLTGLCAPTVNAYRRLRPGQLAGYWANWGFDHRGVTVRIPPERGVAARLEHRLSDGAAPVHTAVAAVLQAARLGVVDKLELGPPESGDGFDNVDATVASPASLGEALEALEADGALCDAVGKELVQQHLAVKRAEWDRYCASTTDWELREYLPFL
ncbi:MAG: glutamine synthetase family protein [Actinomycetota bacterium]|jgi:glutamine synthetase|nr:glutamine synthetase family protein [Actinomycetota bacterium]